MSLIEWLTIVSLIFLVSALVLFFNDVYEWAIAAYVVSAIVITARLVIKVLERTGRDE